MIALRKKSFRRFRLTRLIDPGLDAQTMNTHRDNSLRQFAEAIADSASMLDQLPSGSGNRSVIRPESLPSLLEQCKSLNERVEREKPEPIRTIHHFACTGGTLISKCIASMPNTELLSEIDPLSPLPYRRKPHFSPTDILYLLRYSARPVDDNLLIKVFLGAISALHEELTRQGVRVVIRDHTHSHFCTDQFSSGRPSLLSILKSRFLVRSLVTVRRPFDSYISLKKNGWIHFDPPEFDEYCARYNAFLDEYRDIEIVKYEELVQKPAETMKQICGVLALPFSPSFMDTLDVFSLTGDSGRTGNVIEPREPNEVPAELMAHANASLEYKQLCARLKYDE